MKFIKRLKITLKIKLGDRYNYVDFLLFNYIYNCFVVIELKITELKAEYIGQIIKYINYVDKKIKKPTNKPLLTSKKNLDKKLFLNLQKKELFWAKKHKTIKKNIIK